MATTGVSNFRLHSNNGCLTFGCIATTGVSNFRLHSNDGIRPNTSQYYTLVWYGLSIQHLCNLIQNAIASILLWYILLSMTVQECVTVLFIRDVKDQRQRRLNMFVPVCSWVCCYHSKRIDTDLEATVCEQDRHVAVHKPLNPAPVYKLIRPHSAPVPTVLQYSARTQRSWVVSYMSQSYGEYSIVRISFVVTLSLQFCRLSCGEDIGERIDQVSNTYNLCEREIRGFPQVASQRIYSFCSQRCLSEGRTAAKCVETGNIKTFLCTSFGVPAAVNIEEMCSGMWRRTVWYKIFVGPRPF
jgi:hypothetical protein